ncbi:MAG: porin family protein [Alistipes sp.]|nr:porin family protein [Alistipes sp.]
MMRLVGAVLIFCCAISAQAQNGEGKKNNYELGVSFNVSSPGKYRDAKGNFGGYFEWRHNLSSLPVNIGFLTELSVTKSHQYLYSKGNGWVITYRSLKVMATADYNFLGGKKVRSFAGMGAGVLFGNWETGVFNKGFVTKPCIMPRVGARFFDHITVSADYALTKTEYSHFNFRLGFFF